MHNNIIMYFLLISTSSTDWSQKIKGRILLECIYTGRHLDFHE